MSENSDPAVTQGRPVRLVPTPPGFWLTLLGAGAAVIAPLFGFLVGSASGQGESVGMSSSSSISASSVVEVGCT